MSHIHLQADKIGSGNSTPLIVLHGWRQNRHSLRPLAELLSENREIHLLDLPGFGDSPSPPTTWGTPEYAKSVLNYLDEHHIPQADFLGHSYGGRLSMYISFSASHRVSRLILLDASGVRATPPFKRRAKIQSIKLLRSVLRFAKHHFGSSIYDTWFVPRFASPDYKAAGALKDVFVRIVNEEYSKEVPKISAPTLILWGENDSETPVTVGQKLNSLIRGSKLIVLPEKDHFPYLGSGAALCAFHIKKFFSESSPCNSQSTGVAS